MAENKNKLENEIQKLECAQELIKKQESEIEEIKSQFVLS